MGGSVKVNLKSEIDRFGLLVRVVGTSNPPDYSWHTKLVGLVQGRVSIQSTRGYAQGLPRISHLGPRTKRASGQSTFIPKTHIGATQIVYFTIRILE